MTGKFEHLTIMQFAQLNGYSIARRDGNKVFYAVKGRDIAKRWVQETVEATYGAKGKLIMAQHIILVYTKKPKDW